MKVHWKAIYLTWGLSTLALMLVSYPAWVAHELTHYWAALLANANPELHWGVYPRVEYDWPAPFFVPLAPTIVGLMLMGLAVGMWGLPDLTWYSSVLLLWFSVYIWPSKDDRNPRAIHERDSNTEPAMD